MASYQHNILFQEFFFWRWEVFILMLEIARFKKVIAHLLNSFFNAYFNLKFHRSRASSLSRPDIQLRSSFFLPLFIFSFLSLSFSFLFAKDWFSANSLSLPSFYLFIAIAVMFHFLFLLSFSFSFSHSPFSVFLSSQQHLLSISPYLSVTISLSSFSKKINIS